MSPSGTFARVICPCGSRTIRPSSVRSTSPPPFWPGEEMRMPSTVSFGPTTLIRSPTALARIEAGPIRSNW